MKKDLTLWLKRKRAIPTDKYRHALLEIDDNFQDVVMWCGEEGENKDFTAESRAKKCSNCIETMKNDKIVLRAKFYSNKQ